MDLNKEFEKLNEAEKTWSSSIWFNEQEDPKGEPVMVDLTPHTVGTKNSYVFPPHFEGKDAFENLFQLLSESCAKAGFVLVVVDKSKPWGDVIENRTLGCRCSSIYRPSATNSNP